VGNDLDVLGLIEGRRRTAVHFGLVDAGAALVRAHMQSRMNAVPNAELIIDLERTPGPIDYFAGLAVVAEQGVARYPRFTGSVVKADPAPEGVVIEAMSAVAIAESLIGGLSARGVPHYELVYVLARAAGFREEQINIVGFPAPPRETFEVVVPVDGVDVGVPTDFAGVRFMPADRGLRALGVLEIADEMRTAFDAPAYALALATASRMLDAEEEGLAQIDLALSWLTVRLRYGLATLPDSRLLSFRRRESLARPGRRDLVSVRGLLTGRQWLRRPEVVQEERAVSLHRRPRLDPDLPQLTLQERLALLALARATREPEPLARVHALWEAIEFYAKGTTVDLLFTNQDLEELRALLQNVLPARFTERQRQRVIGQLDRLNDPPLLVRLRAALDVDAVPYADGDIELLSRLRRLRNKVVHGRSRELPQAEDVEHATSIVARMLVYRIARRSREQGLTAPPPGP
jgi:hypothetical protein